MHIYVVDPTHIDVLLSVAINGPSEKTHGWVPPLVDELLADIDREGPIGPKTADLAGRALLKACVESVSSYHLLPPGQLPGPQPNPVPEQYEWTDFDSILDPIETCRAISLYEHHSRRSPAWLWSGAHWFCHHLRVAVNAQMPGYQEAPAHWETALTLHRARQHREAGEQ
jgi:hypothetical protein